MPLEDLIIPVSLALVLGFALGFYYVKTRITAIEEKSRAELETWKRETAGEIRKDSVNRSRSTLKGKIAEQMAPVLPDFCFNSGRCTVYRISGGLYHLRWPDPGCR